MDSVCSLLSIHQARLIIAVLLINCTELASFATPDRWVLTSGLNALLGSRGSHQRLIGHGFHRLLVVLKPLLVVEELWLPIQFLLRGKLVLRTHVRVVIRLESVSLRRVISCSLSRLLYDLHWLSLGYLTWKSIFLLQSLQLLLEVLSNQLEQLYVWLPSLCIPNPPHNSKSIHELVERKTIVRCRFGVLRVVVLPKLFVFEHNFLKVLKSDNHGIDLAQFAELEKLDGWYSLSISRKMNEN